MLKLTALFTARKGRSFATALQAQEGRSYQFEFLRPSHSLFGYFNRLVEQYRLVMDPPPLLLKGIREGAFGGEDAEEKLLLGAGRGGGRQKTLEKIKRRIEWERWVRERRKRAEDEQEKERGEFFHESQEPES